MLTADEIIREAAAAGFHPEPMEKALRLLDLLDAVRARLVNNSDRFRFNAYRVLLTR
jgi:hypothetical protein